MSEEEKKEEVRVGVFICHCGSNIGGYIDCKEVAERAKKLPNVVYTQDNLYTCSETGLAQIRKGIQEHNLNRVVVASCTPRTHEPLFRSCIEDEGLNPYLFNFVNIRDQNTWVHQKQREEAFDKANELVKMGTAKASKLESLDKIIVDVTPTALVIGGGVSGITAALNLANQGFETHLVEKQAELGGHLKGQNILFPTDQSASELLDSLKQKISSNNKLTVYTSTRVKSIGGFVGNYEIEVDQGGDVKELKIGVIIVAVGAVPFKPEGMLGYDGQKSIAQNLKLN